MPSRLAAIFLSISFFIGSDNCQAAAPATESAHVLRLAASATEYDGKRAR
jgi:hypothetical protein